MNKNLEKAIKNISKEDEFWNVLIEESKPKSGPFDGGCLICADAIINAMGEGGLVRIESNIGGKPQTEHYGATIKGYVYDMHGMHDGPDEWVQSLRKEAAHLGNTALRINFQHDSKSEIVRDTAASQKIGQLLREEVARLSEVNVVSFRVGTLKDWELFRDHLKYNNIDYNCKSTGLNFELQLQQGKTIEDAFDCALNLSNSQVILDTIRPCPLNNNRLERRYNGREIPKDWMKFSKGYDQEVRYSELDSILTELRVNDKETLDPGGLLAQVNLELMSSKPTKDDLVTLKEIQKHLTEDKGILLYQGRHLKDTKALDPLKQAIKNIELGEKYSQYVSVEMK